MGWKSINILTPKFYEAHGGGNIGDGERYHQHTISQSFVCLKGSLRVTINGVDTILDEGGRVFAPSNAMHGAIVIEDGTEYRSEFFEPDNAPIDWARICREQVPSLSQAEINERKRTLV